MRSAFKSATISAICRKIPKLRATHGMVFYREMDCDLFLMCARELEKSIEGEMSN